MCGMHSSRRDLAIGEVGGGPPLLNLVTPIEDRLWTVFHVAAVKLRFSGVWGQKIRVFRKNGVAPSIECKTLYYPKIELGLN